MDHWDDPLVDVLHLVRSWLCDESEGQWTMVVDRAGSPGAFFPHGKSYKSVPATSTSNSQLLSDLLPQSLSGPILFTSRNQNIAWQLPRTSSGNTIVEVKPMNTDEGMSLLAKQLGSIAYRDEVLRLLEILDSTPLAITQAAAFISQRTASMALSHCVDEFQKSDNSRTRSLEHNDSPVDPTNTPVFSRGMINSDVSSITRRLTTAIEDLHDLLPAVRLIQPEQNTSNIHSSKHHFWSRANQPEGMLPNVPLPKLKPSEKASATTRPISAVSIVAGTNGLKQLGLSISDITSLTNRAKRMGKSVRIGQNDNARSVSDPALVNQGKRFGNFVRAGQNDNHLFDVLDEVQEALFKRIGLVDARKMRKRWPTMHLVHHGAKVKGEIVQSLQTESSIEESNQRRMKKTTRDDVDSFTWVMVAITSALDDCLPSNEIQELLIQVFVEVLDRRDDFARVLRISIKKIIESWRLFGCAREIGLSVKKQMRKSLSNGVSDQLSVRAVPQLNMAETKNAKDMLVWLLRGDATAFDAMSPITFSMAGAWELVGLNLCTDGLPIRESQACVTFHEGQLAGRSNAGGIPTPRGLGSRPLQISWPRDKPESMIDVLGVGRALEDTMYRAWQYGTHAADQLKLLGGADRPYSSTNEVYYTLEAPDDARVSRRYEPHIGTLSEQGFPVDTEKMFAALEWMLEGEPVDSLRWLQNHVASDYLLRVDGAAVLRDVEYTQVFFKYQALMFGFYYQLLKQLLSFDLVEPNAFFHGIWGTHSTTPLIMCTQLGRCLRTEHKVSRAHILYVLAAMYNGRRKVFNTTSTLPLLVGILGPISVLTLPLIRTTDDPKEISRIAVVDLPIVDLIADSADGELMATDGGGLTFSYPTELDRAETIVTPTGPTHSWTVRPCMSTALSAANTSGVVMAARCGKRLVGWFNPLAADVLFLSSAYLTESYSEKMVVAFGVRDEHWEAGKILQPNPNQPGSEFGVVHSHGSSSLRYAAAGFYAERVEEIAIARTANEFSGAFDMVQAQDQGIVIA
ncbi:hypothetical protein IG631_19885 [Alternaria alternata]|nr:hypothetical protein IG631_19885 [Alternaria alternata]